MQNLNNTKLQNNTRETRDMDCRSSNKSASVDCPLFLGPRFSKTVLVERCRKQSHETWVVLGCFRGAPRELLGVSWELLGAPWGSWEVLGAEDENTQTLHAEKTAKCITHKAQMHFWKNGDCQTPLTDRFWDELGKAISYRSALEDFGERN